jgi:hypothetical protein
METIQDYLQDNERVEIYNSHYIFYNMDTNQEAHFDTLTELVTFLKNK